MNRWGIIASAGFVVLGALGGCGGATRTDDGGGAGGASGAGYGGTPFGGAGGTPFGGTGGMPIGGTGGMPIGGMGGVPSAGAGGMPPGGTGGGTCEGCPSWKLGGIVPMPACCAPGTQCGAQVTQTISSLLGSTLLPGCHPINQPGGPDPSCPAVTFVNPIDGEPARFAGCCRAQTGSCGILVDLTTADGPFIGCTQSAGAAGSGQPCGSTDDCGTCVQKRCESQLSQCATNLACVSIIECTRSCTDQLCYDKCYISYPPGQNDFNDLRACAGANCSVECA